ncbi:MAG: SEL1-like repeat protein [Hyphomonadaceae bacterium]|nr:SEL1-like repeat protein [Hyphomonadaceae bacterium]
MAFTDSEIQEAHGAAMQPEACPTDLYKLGLIYSTGQTGEVDLVRAHMWFNLAAMRGSEAAKECRRELADQMTQNQIADAQRAAREWLSRRH